MKEFIFEVNRKAFHLLGLLYSGFYLLITKTTALKFMLLVSSVVIMIDVLRSYIPMIDNLCGRWLGSIMRPEEKEVNRISGASWMVLVLALSCLLLEKPVTIIAWTVLFVADALAALVGKRWGRTKITSSSYKSASNSNVKTLEGSLTFFISTLTIGIVLTWYFKMHIPIVKLIGAAITSTLTELYAKKLRLDDNFLIPCVYGLSLIYL